jgi:hypothetical protein
VARKRDRSAQEQERLLRHDLCLIRAQQRTRRPRRLAPVATAQVLDAAVRRAERGRAVHAA